MTGDIAAYAYILVGGCFTETFLRRWNRSRSTPAFGVSYDVPFLG